MNEITELKTAYPEDLKPFDVLAERWANYLSLDTSKKTMQTYIKNVRQFYLWLQDRNISRPTREDVIKYRDWLKDSGHKPNTVQGYIVALKQFGKWAEFEGLYPNIFRDVKGARIDSEYKKDYLTSSQEKQLLNHIDLNDLKGQRDFAMIALMLTTGLRTISVAEANIEDIRPCGDHMVLYYKGKGHEEKATYVKIAEPVYKAITDYIKNRKPKSKGEALFCSLANKNYGEPLTTASISRIIKTRLRDINLDSERLTAHSLRHTACTQNILNGGTIEETQQLANHANINTTMKYVHALRRETNNSEIRLANALFD